MSKPETVNNCIITFSTENESIRAMKYFEERQIETIEILSGENKQGFLKMRHYTLICGISGFILVFFLQLLIHRNHQIIVGDKNTFNLLTFIPVSFLSGIFSSTLCLAFFFFNQQNKKNICADKFHIIIEREKFLTVKDEFDLYFPEAKTNKNNN